MQYPTSEEVEKADRIQLARWYRFLPSPGWTSASKLRLVFETAITKEKSILARIVIRFNEMGGFTPGISKAIGWEK